MTRTKKNYTRAWRIHGAAGHRQKASFWKSVKWDFSEGENVRILDIENCDKTGTNDYTVIRITRNTPAECVEELYGQLSDGYFENVRIGNIEEITE